ncbi:MAG: periplasmic heavy metal sensor [Candidatus Delongbacteria bacterium]|nr:periplasmic heavy metal sensor [Candidatus Delongbacteria bacterium]
MKKRTLTVSGLLLCVMIAFAGPGRGGPMTTQGGGMQMRGIDSGMILHLLDNEDLNLSDQQQQQITEIVETEALRDIDHRADMEKLQLRMQSLQMAKETDITAMEQMIDDISAARAEAMKRHLRTRISIQELLDDEQRELMQKMMRKQGRHRDGPPGPPDSQFGPGQRGMMKHKR